MRIQERIQTAWDTGDPQALHCEVEILAAEGHSQQSLEDALEALLPAVRKAGASDATEEIINGVWDRGTSRRDMSPYLRRSTVSRRS